MRFLYQQESQPCEIIYGETFASMIRQQNLQDRQIILCGNQRYYDRYAEKIAQLIPASNTQDWLITPNSRYCNRFDYFEEFLKSQRRFARQKPTLYIGLGNEGLMELTLFLQQVSPLNSSVWLIPVSLRAFTKSLVGKPKIFSVEQITALMELTSVPEKILFDQTLADRQIEGKMVDLLELIVCGLVCDSSFLRELYHSFPTAKKLFAQSFAAFIEPVILFYQKQGKVITSFGQVFEQAFFKTANSHLLSDSMKRLLGILFELAWTIQKGDLDFNFKNFMLWLYGLGYPLEVPAEISLSEYGEQVINLAFETPITTLVKIGEVGESAIPTETELAEVFHDYQQLVEEIRGE